MVSNFKAFTCAKHGRAPRSAGSRTVTCCAGPSPSADGPDRRALLATALLLPAAAPAPAAALGGPFELFSFRNNTPAMPALPPNTLRDAQLAYQFTYPTRTASGADVPIVVSRKPEKYSSAAPLTADARERIVAELVSLKAGITYSVFVGPVSGALADMPEADWTAKAVARCVLTDRSVSRNTQGQRIPVATVESSSAEERDGSMYYVFETVQAGSPNLYDVSRDTYRQGLNVTASRRGLNGTPYLYTLSLACPSGAWADMYPGFKAAVDSFRLLATDASYIPPDKDPWKFF